MAEPAREALDRSLEGGVLERRDPPAAVADDVVVMIAARDQSLVARAAVAQLDPLHEPRAVEEVERPIDARGPDPVAARADPLGDLLRAETAILAGEELDHGLPRPAGAVPRLAEHP